MFVFPSTFEFRTLESCLPLAACVRLIVWFVIGVAVYISYGVRRSELAQPPPRT